MKTYSILVIDDSTIDYKIIRKVLESSNQELSVIHNQNGYNYIEQIKEFDVKVILLDLMEEAIQGISILRTLKSLKETSDIPVIICSTVLDQANLNECLALGIYDYVEKPFDDLTLHATLLMKTKNALESVLGKELINYLTQFDSVSGLKTRKYIEKIYNEHTKRHGLSVLLLDVNSLKLLNDTYGSDIGDQVLFEIGRAIDKLSSYYISAARWGNDELIMLLGHAQKKKVEELMTTLNREIKINQTYEYDVTFGYALMSSHTQKMEELIRIAEDALQSNKILESNTVRRQRIDSILKTLHEKNPREELHSQRVSFLCGKICEEMDFSEFETKRVKLAGLMHDIGKITISEDILNKPDKLDKKEWLEIKKHPENGFKILSTSIDTMEISNAILTHHERWDGKGYPKGLERESIPLMARIIAVADTFDAMTSTRSYKSCISIDKATEEIRQCSGSQFDPIVVSAFMQYLEKNKNGKAI